MRHVRGLEATLESAAFKIESNLDSHKRLIVCLIGSNETLSGACRVHLENLCPSAYRVLRCESSEVPPDCNIYIWDSDSSPSIPGVLATANAAKIVIVKRSSLSHLRRKLSGTRVTFLHSPVTPLSLKAVLEATVAQLQLQRDDVAARLKLDRDRILQQLLETHSRLREYDQDRSNFLTRSIHDMRVPLMAIQGYCGLLLAGQLGPTDSEQSRVLERMQRSLTRLSRLVDAMMDLGTGCDSAMKLRLEPASIEACAQQAAHEILPFVQRKQINLKVDLEAPSGALLFDASQIEQVFVNLLDNACRFTEKGGEITIRGRSLPSQVVREVGLKEDTGGYRIDVTDTGSGIDPDHVEEIFDEHTSYGHLNEGVGNSRSGFGLGLAICRMIIHAHNGRIWVDSASQGTSFSFVLPLIKAFDNSKALQAAV